MTRYVALWIFLVSAVSGCAHQDKPSSTDERHVVRMSNSVDLAKLLRADEQVNLTHKLNLLHGEGLIYFGELDTFDDDDLLVTAAPIIARKSGGGWVGIRIADPRLKDASWAYVGAGPNRGEIWGILDQVPDIVDEVQSDLIIAHSTDGGETFALTQIRKPDDLATFDSICIGPGGHGRLSMYLSTEEESTEHPGFYHFLTSDSGRTWVATPKYEPDALSAAQGVTEDEQPDIKSPVQTASFAKHRR